MSSFGDSIDLHVWLYKTGLLETTYMFSEYGLMIANGKWFNDRNTNKNYFT